MPQTRIDLLRRGLEANLADPFRKVNLITLPETGSVVLTGDIHGHRRNFERIVTYADLPNHPDRHIIFQEIIHGGPEDGQGGCISYRLLFDAVRFKLQFPNQVHFLMGNHDTACITNSDVMKAGKEMNRAMGGAIEREFGRRAEDIRLALRQFLFSQALAVRTANRIWMSHSLPGENVVARFDPEIFGRTLKINDVVRPGSAYLLTWGRRHTHALLHGFARLFDVDLFIMGHQPQSEGWKKVADNCLILASDHDHGHILPVDLSRTYSLEQLINDLVALTSIA